MKMRSLFVLTTLAVTALCGPVSSGHTYLTPEKANLLRKGQALLLDDRFHEADSVYSEYARLDSIDPAGSLFRASVLLARMSDAEDDFVAQQFKNLLDSTDSLVEQQLPLSDSAGRAWLMLIKGHTRAYRSIYESRFGSFLSAVKQGLSARNCYSDGLEFDSTLYDLYLGLGSYHYWKSAKGGVLRFVGILKNDRELGIEELRVARDSALFSTEAAHSALIWIYLNEKELDSAVVFAELMHSRYPQGRSFLWPLAEAYTGTEKYQEAIETYLILRSHFERSPGNYYNLIEIDFAICRLAEKMNDADLVREQALIGSAYFAKLSEQMNKRQRSKLAHLRRQADSR